MQDDPTGTASSRRCVVAVSDPDLIFEFGDIIQEFGMRRTRIGWERRPGRSQAPTALHPLPRRQCSPV